MDYVKEAVKNHSSGYSCSGAVLCAFHDAAGLSMSEAEVMARPLAGGMKVKCGAVLAAEAVLQQKFPSRESAQKIAEFEDKFISMNQSVICRELRGLTGGQRLRSCRGCVTDAAEILAGMV